jgi:hypothetical protein
MKAPIIEAIWIRICYFMMKLHAAFKQQNRLPASVSLSHVTGKSFV